MSALLVAVLLAAAPRSEAAIERERTRALDLDVAEVGAGFLSATLVSSQTTTYNASQNTFQSSRTAASGLLVTGHLSAFDGRHDTLLRSAPGFDLWATFGLLGDSTLVDSKTNNDIVHPPKGDWGLEVRLAFPWTVLSFAHAQLSAGLGGLLASGGMPGNRGHNQWLNLTVVARLSLDVFGVAVRLEADQGLYGFFSTPKSNAANQLQVRALVGSLFGCSATLVYSASDFTALFADPNQLPRHDRASSDSMLSVGLSYRFGAD